MSVKICDTFPNNILDIIKLTKVHFIQELLNLLENKPLYL